ncbi:hypothetical protein TNCV_5050571 [Trichonephila clavipes]|nr:hypothetical protein TNCV_5050571 [Trichonephila clavipes]
MSARIVERVTVGSTRACHTILLSSLLVVFLVAPDPVFRAWIVRVQYFVRGGFVGYRSRASSKHLFSHLPVDGARFLGGQKGDALHLQMHVDDLDIMVYHRVQRQVSVDSGDREGPPCL